MIYVGIDIAKLNHFASAISSDGTELMKPFKFTNNGDGFQLLHSHLTPLKTDKVGTSIIAKTLMLQDFYKFVSFYNLDLMDQAAGTFPSENH